ncbi:MAG: acyloxyacyl hydrolase [Longimicrobiales bacterium]|nr:acyloxyacyl hydrolase [Longimicrobiales bacterium]
MRARSLRHSMIGITVVAVALAGTPMRGVAQDPAVFYIGGAALVAVVPGFLFDTPQPDAQRTYIKTSLGRFDAVDQENMALDLLVEYRPGLTWHRIRPLVGVAGNTDGTLYAWASAAHDFHLAGRLVVNVNSGPAFYLAGDRGKDLGSRGALRSGFEIGYRTSAGARVTASFHHMSHGKLLNPDWNPGTEVIALNASWPIG